MEEGKTGGIEVRKTRGREEREKGGKREGDRRVEGKREIRRRLADTSRISEIMKEKCN